MFWRFYIVALPVFLLLDTIWLGLVAKKFYAEQLGFLLSESVNWIAAILFYLLFIAGVVVFVLLPFKKETTKKNVVKGAFFGVITYATYDLTNLATIENWPLLVTIVDIIWGGILSASVVYITLQLVKK